MEVGYGRGYVIADSDILHGIRHYTTVTAQESCKLCVFFLCTDYLNVNVFIFHEEMDYTLSLFFV